jgi:hypothetical protein
MCCAWGSWEMHTNFGQKPEAKIHLGDLDVDVDGRII